MTKRIRKGGPATFVTFEGIEGSGKSTQVALLARVLRRGGREVVVTREPGGSPLGLEIRALMLSGRGDGMDGWAELFLIEAARTEHLRRVVRPALERGAVVLCDRFTDSTLAYQGFGRGLPLAAIRALHRLPALGPRPDLTILLDLPVGQGLIRARSRNRGPSAARRRSESRIDNEPTAFHTRVRRGFLAIARSEPNRVVVVPAKGEVAAVGTTIAAVARARLLGRL